MLKLDHLERRAWRAGADIDAGLFHSQMFTDYERNDSWPSGPYKPNMRRELREFFYGMVADLIACPSQP